MAGDSLQPMPMSPRHAPGEIGSAAVQWVCTRRGRTTVLVATLFTILLALTGLRHHEVVSSQYRNFSAQYGWSYKPHFPSIIHTPFKTPSNTTIQLENGEIDIVPAALKKTTPNFHLLLPSDRDTDGFCKTTLSAMLLNYPPPTVVNLYAAYESDEQWERDTLNSTFRYLSNKKAVQDDDLVLIVDGQQSWFQLPSDVIITQYKRILEDANLRLLRKYGLNEDGYQRFNQTIVFGADKSCANDDMACRYVPASILPSDTYGEGIGHRIADTPARYINSKMVMGPAGDLRAFYAGALLKYRQNRSQFPTVQSTFATLFGEQQLRRDAIAEKKKPISAKFREFFTGSKPSSNRVSPESRLRDHVTIDNVTRHEFSVGLDYAHMLFQPLAYCTPDELVPMLHDNSTDLSEYIRRDSFVDRLTLPQALSDAKPPFWRPDLIKHNPSPNEKPAYIDKLEFASDLDSMPRRKTPWHSVELVHNTYTGAVPAILQNAPYYEGIEHPPTANITWHNLWFSDYKRALLRNYFRKQQSSTRYHDSLVGGDRSWDMRGGRGGVWTATEQIWLPWGEIDGVCGSVSQLNEAFSDNKGIWLHEKEDDAEEMRLSEETAMNAKIEAERMTSEQQKEMLLALTEEEEANAQEVARLEEEHRIQREMEGRKKNMHKLMSEEERKNEEEEADREWQEQLKKEEDEEMEAEQKMEEAEGAEADDILSGKIVRRWTS
ncbi:hypothetical protein ACN47E_002098 [Coniothyrium glycines]